MPIQHPSMWFYFFKMCTLKRNQNSNVARIFKQQERYISDQLTNPCRNLQQKNLTYYVKYILSLK